MKLFSQSELVKYFGNPTPSGSAYLTKIELPYPMYYDKQEVRYMRCHKLVSDAFAKVFKDILSYYGKSKIHELEIDDYGGCFNYRMMRGSTKKLSTHSWGIAIDLDPNRNTLHQTHKTAQFAKPEYKKMIDIFYDHGFLNLGREKDMDWMHFQYGLIPK
jgi:hypothetical protein